MRAAEPLPLADRGPFLEAVAQRLRGLEELGDGILHRTIAQTQREFFDPPVLKHATPVSPVRRKGGSVRSEQGRSNWGRPR